MVLTCMQEAGTGFASKARPTPQFAARRAPPVSR